MTFKEQQKQVEEGFKPSIKKAIEILGLDKPTINSIKNKTTIRMVIKESTNKIYAGVHWTKRKLIKDTYLYEVKSKKAQFPIPTEFPIDLEMEFEYNTRVLDSSNSSFLFKVVEDCLVKIGVFPDDTIKYIRSAKMTSYKGKNNQIHIIY